MLNLATGTSKLTTVRSRLHFSAFFRYRRKETQTFAPLQAQNFISSMFGFNHRYYTYITSIY